MDNELLSFRSRKHVLQIMIVIYTFIFTILYSCGYTVLTRRFNDQVERFGEIHEWTCSVYLAAYYRLIREDLKEESVRKRYGSNPQENYFYYSLSVGVGTITKLDTALTKAEQHELKVDSVRLVFKDFDQIFITHNSYEDNARNQQTLPGSPWFARSNVLSVDSIYIPEGILDAKVIVYGTIRSQISSEEPFWFSRNLVYEDRADRIWFDMGD